MLIDFAAEWSELEGIPFEITVNPLDLEEPERLLMPTSLPAGARLHLIEVRARRGVAEDGALKLSSKDLRTVAGYLFGKAALQRWLDARITEEALTDVVMLVLATYQSGQLQSPDHEA